MVEGRSRGVPLIGPRRVGTVNGNARRRNSALVALMLMAIAGCGGTSGADDASGVVATAVGATTDATTLPGTWIDQWLERIDAGTADRVPDSIVRFDEPEGTLYLVEYGCCDQFSDLYDSDGRLVGHPDGGIAGDGDGSTTFEPTTKGVTIFPDS